MGYELNIVRQTDYQDGEEESNISLDEWLNYVSTDKELELTNGFETKIPGIAKTWQESPGFCNWVGHPKSDTDIIPWFDYGFGCITAKNPDCETIEKMIRISIALNAKDRGDDFEYYDETYFTNGGHPILEQQTDTKIDQPLDNNIKKPWWKFWWRFPA